MVNARTQVDSANSIPPLEARRIVFVSHANPEDNAIAAWFGAHLTAAGYEVWTDLTRLLGGEEMWADIDDALRYHARKVVVLLSRAAADRRKEGLRAEISRAEAIRRKLGDRRYVIPIRIDDLPFENTPPTIGSRTIIDGGRNLAAGLAQCLKILDEDGVARRQTPSSQALANWHALLVSDLLAPEQRMETLLTNWLRVICLPERLRLYSIERPLSNPLSEPASIASAHPLPVTAHLRRLIAFAEYDEIQEPLAHTTPVKFERVIGLKEFLAGGDEDFEIAPYEARKHLKSLLRQAFDRFASSKGLQPYVLSAAKTAWWIPENFLEDSKVRFIRPSGVRGWRQLCGEFGARGRKWHFGINAVPLLDPEPVFKMTGHVIFTDPTGQHEPTAEYRRAMCRLWFNGKWRDLFLAMLRVLSAHENTFALPFGRSAHAEVGATPITVLHPVRIPPAAELKAAASVETEGDAEDFDASERNTDPAFLADFEDDEPDLETDE